MPRLLKTLIPYIRKSLRCRDLPNTLGRCLIGPVYVLRWYKEARRLAAFSPSEFDRDHGVETAAPVHLSDLEIESRNWIYGSNYGATHPEVFSEALNLVRIDFEDFIFVDFGSGKGRTLVMASKFPFRKIIGIEFSPQLNAVALENIRNYRSATQKCKEFECLCADFTTFGIPPEPAVFFFNPCQEPALTTVVKNIQRSLDENPREIHIVYVDPAYGNVFENAGLVKTFGVNGRYSVYSNTRARALGPTAARGGI